MPSVPAPTGSGSFLVDGRTIVAVDPDGLAGLWDVETGRRRLGFPVSRGRALGLAPRTQPRRHPSCCHRGRRRPSPRPRVGRPGRDPRRPCRGLGGSRSVWSPDSQRLALLGGEYRSEDDGRGVALILDRDGTLLARLVEEPQVLFRSAAFVGDGRRLAVTRELPRPAPGQIGVQVWDWHEEKVVDEYTALPGDSPPTPPALGSSWHDSGQGTPTSTTSIPASSCAPSARFRGRERGHLVSRRHTGRDRRGRRHRARVEGRAPVASRPSCGATSER